MVDSYKKGGSAMKAYMPSSYKNMMLSAALVASVILLVFWSGNVHALPPGTPVYTKTFSSEGITGDNAFFDAGLRYWTIDAGADSYQNEFYERPTVQTYTYFPAGGQYAANEYYENVDIVEAKVGFDTNFLYISIELFGRNKSTSDGIDTPEGLVYRYGFRFSTDPDGRFGFFLRTDKPELVNMITFGTLGNTGFEDTDGDVGGRALINGMPPSGLSVTKEDNPAEEQGLNGYDQSVIFDGLAAGIPVLYSRINPTNDKIVELAFAYKDFGLTEAYISSLQYLDMQASKEGPSDPQKFFWNDKYNKSEAGSPNWGGGSIESK